jgi:hypothetical protein
VRSNDCPARPVGGDRRHQERIGTSRASGVGGQPSPRAPEGPPRELGARPAGPRDLVGLVGAGSPALKRPMSKISRASSSRGLSAARGDVDREGAWAEPCPSPKFHPPTWRLSETLGWQCVVDQTALPAWRRRVSQLAAAILGDPTRWRRESVGGKARWWGWRGRAGEVTMLLAGRNDGAGPRLRGLARPSLAPAARPVSRPAHPW